MALHKRQRKTLLMGTEEPIKVVDKLDDSKVYKAVNEDGEELLIGMPDWAAEQLEGEWFTFHWDEKRFVIDDLFDEE